MLTYLKLFLWGYFLGVATILGSLAYIYVHVFDDKGSRAKVLSNRIDEEAEAQQTTTKILQSLGILPVSRCGSDTAGGNSSSGEASGPSAPQIAVNPAPGSRCSTSGGAIRATTKKAVLEIPPSSSTPVLPPATGDVISSSMDVASTTNAREENLSPQESTIPDAPGEPLGGWVDISKLPVTMAG